MNEVFWIIMLTLAPFLELRGSIPYGLFSTELSPFWVVSIAIIANVALAPLSYVFLYYVEHLFRHISFIDRFWTRTVERAQRKVSPHIEKYGILGVAVFIGVPLPGTGVYTAALGAYTLGVSFRNFFIASIIGVCIAAIIVTAVSLLGKGVWLWL